MCTFSTKKGKTGKEQQPSSTKPLSRPQDELEMSTGKKKQSTLIDSIRHLHV